MDFVENAIHYIYFDFRNHITAECEGHDVVSEIEICNNEKKIMKSNNSFRTKVNSNSDARSFVRAIQLNDSWQCAWMRQPGTDRDHKSSQ